MSFARFKTKLTEHLIEHFNLYTEYHTDSADQLVYDATEFFNDARNFTSDIVDVLVKATADALNLKLKIFRRSPAGNIQCEVIQAPNATMEVMLEFTTAGPGVSATYTGANHYNSVSRLNPTSNFQSVGNEHPTVATTQVESVGIESEVVSGVDNSDSETTGISAIPESNELVIEGERGDALIQTYLRPGTVFPVNIFRNVEPKCVNFLPPNINGNKYYLVKCTEKDLTKKTQDRRWFYMRTSSKKGLKGIRKVGTCMGSWECRNPSCSFLSTQGKKNWWHFEFRNGTRVCYSCGVYATQIPCGARKLIEYSFGSERAHVYIIGEHNCKLQPETNDDVEFTRQWVKKYPGLSYKQLKSTVIQFLVESGDNESAEQAAYRITNRAYKKNRREQGLTVDDTPVSTQSIEAVAEVKKGSDRLDKFHIFRMNNSSLNDLPDFVIKSSSTILPMALEMDQEGDKNALQEEDAFFDGSHSRCTGYISLGLWVHHPALRRVIRLVSMEVKSESTENLVLFWRLVNEMLQKLGKKGKDYKFNPKFLMTDEAGAHFAACRIVFGDEWVKEKCVTCQWHFLNSINEKIHLIDEKFQEEFLEKAKQLCIVPTIPEFELLFARLKEIANMSPQYGNSLDWYYARRMHLFPAFREGLHSGLNLAEVGNSAWKPKSRLSLVTAAYDDINTMLQQEADYKRFKEGQNFTRGKGKTDMQRAAQEKRKQMEQGRAYAELLGNEAAIQMQREGEANPPYFLPNRGAQHKPKRNRKGVEGKGRKKSLVAPTLNSIMEKLNQAKGIVTGNIAQEVPCPIDGGDQVLLGSGPEPRPVRPIPSTPSNPNPPLVTEVIFTVTVCQGCPNEINSRSLTPPHNLLIRMRAIRPYMDPRTRIWHDKIGNAYFHLDVQCLQKFNPALKVEDLTMTNEMFCGITPLHMQHLRQLGFLQHIANNIEKNIQVSSNIIYKF